MHQILREIGQGGMAQEYYVFNTGGVGADSNDEASGDHYRKIPRELTLMLQEALLREAVRFEHDDTLGSDIAVAIVDSQGKVALDLRDKWIPKEIYGEQEYVSRMSDLSRRRYYSLDAADKAIKSAGDGTEFGALAPRRQVVNSHSVATGRINAVFCGNKPS